MRGSASVRLTEAHLNRLHINPPHPNHEYSRRWWDPRHDKFSLASHGASQPLCVAASTPIGATWNSYEGYINNQMSFRSHVGSSVSSLEIHSAQTTRNQFFAVFADKNSANHGIGQNHAFQNHTRTRRQLFLRIVLNNFCKMPQEGQRRSSMSSGTTS